MDENATQPVVIDIQKSVQTTPTSSDDSLIETGNLKENGNKKRKTDEQKLASLGAFELKVERKVEQHIVPRSDRRWDNHDRISISQPEYVDDLPPIDIDDEVNSFFVFFSNFFHCSLFPRNIPFLQICLVQYLALKLKIK